MGILLTIVVFFIIAFMSLYLLIILIASWIPDSKGEDIDKISSNNTLLNKKQIRVLVAIPAHNEEKNIEQTINSLLTVDKYYNESNILCIMEIVVIADACTDKTTIIARDLGVNVVERAKEQDNTMQQNAGKGQALDWFMHTHRSMLERNDYIIIVDADTVVEKNFMTCMVDFCTVKKVQVGQCFYDVLNIEKSWRNKMLSVALRALHHTRSKGRMIIGGSAGLKGNGMIFTSMLLQKYGWPAYSIAEDAEFSAKLALEDIPVAYISGTTVYGDMPTTAKNASEQRARWENGHWLMVRAWLPKFWRKWQSSPSLLVFDSIMNCIIPPITVFVVLQCLTILLCYIFMPQLFNLSLSLLLITSLYILSGLMQTKSSWRLYFALLFSPLYMLWKLWLYIVKIGRNTSVWKPSKREKSE